MLSLLVATSARVLGVIGEVLVQFWTATVQMDCLADTRLVLSTSRIAQAPSSILPETSIAQVGLPLYLLKSRVFNATLF